MKQLESLQDRRDSGTFSLVRRGAQRSESIVRALFCSEQFLRPKQYSSNMAEGSVHKNEKQETLDNLQEMGMFIR